MGLVGDFIRELRAGASRESARPAGAAGSDGREGDVGRGPEGRPGAAALLALGGALFKAARPLSLSLAFYATSLGAALALTRGGAFARGRLGRDLLVLALVTIAGLAVQTATNLINDYFECGQKEGPRGGRRFRFLGLERPAFDVLVFLAGAAAFALTGAIGLWLLAFASGKLLWVGLAGLVGGYCYTGEPVVYKRLGLGALLSFVLMGPLMNYGAWLALTDRTSLLPVLLGLPPSLLVPVLMLSNELRDHARDSAMGIRTLVVRIGFRRGRVLYAALLALAFLLPALYAALGLVHPAACAVLLTLPLAAKAYRKVAEARPRGVPVTNALHLAFGAIYIAALLLGQA